MIHDPGHLNDLSRMAVGHAARAAFLHAASNGGYPPDLFDPLRLDLFVSLALCVHVDRTADDDDQPGGAS